MHVRGPHLTIAMVAIALVAPALAAKPDPEAAKQLAAEEQFMASLKSGKHDRWSTLPDWIRYVHISTSGDAWFTADRLSDTPGDESLIQSVERAAAGQTRVIRGEMICVDRAGRFIVRGNRNNLLVYDPATKKWINRYVNGTESSNQPNKRDPGQEGFFQRGSWEDLTGSDWFIGGSKQLGWFIHRLARDGTWTTWQVFKEQAVSDFPIRWPILVEQNGGCFVLCTRNEPEDQDPTKVIALRFDGKSWAPVDPRFCTVKEHGTTRIIPNRDGSITTICGGHALWTYWPADALDQAAKHINELIDSLSNPDPQIRENAHQRLALMGSRPVDLMSKAIDSAPPEGQQRLKSLIKNAGQGQDVRSKPDHGDIPYGGEWIYLSLYLCSRNDLGHVALYLDEPENVVTHQKYDMAIAIVQDDGSWRVQPASHDQWESTGWKSIPQDAFVDRQGRIWADNATRIIDTDMKMRALPPSGLQFSDMIGEDSAGRFYLRGGGHYYVLDESGGETASQLATKSFPGLGPYSFSGDSSATAISTERDSLLLLHDGDAKRVKTDFGGGAMLSLLPLRQGAALIGGGDHIYDTEWMFWDGQKGISGPGALTLVQQNLQIILKLASRELAQVNDPQIAVDDRGNLWFTHRYWKWTKVPAKAKQSYTEEFRYYDGQQWHDVLADLGGNKPDGGNVPIAAVNNARWLLVRSGTRLLSISYRDGKLVSNEVIKDLRGTQPPDHIVNTSWGDTWAVYRSQLLLIRDGTFELQDRSAVPLLGDADGRLWCVSGDQLVANDHGKWLQTSISGTDRQTQMIQTSDKRIWVLHRDALSELNVENGAIKEVGRWPWGSPRSGFPGLATDGSGYLWFTGNNNDCVRLTLPQQITPAAPK